MRIIQGKFKGKRLLAPKNLPVRPTTDQAKEALFTILGNQFDFEDIHLLDLFSGTGNISYECASRGCKNIVAVDRSFHCVDFITKTVKDLQIDGFKVIKADVLKYLANENKSYDLIFADPPYDLPNLQEIVKIIFEKKLIKPWGWLVMEHATLLKMDHLPNFKETRTYGNSTFSIFELAKSNK